MEPEKTPETPAEDKPFRFDYRETPIGEKAKSRKLHTTIFCKDEKAGRIKFWSTPCWNRVETQTVTLLSVKAVEPE
jgi:hypothetical protein